MNRVIGFDSQQVVDLLFQGINTILLIAIVILIIRLGLLGIKALKIYIKKNSQLPFAIYRLVNSIYQNGTLLIGGEKWN